MQRHTPGPQARPTSFSADGTPSHGAPFVEQSAAPHDTPSRAVVSPSTASHVDARGRRITVRKLTALDFYRLTKLVPPPQNEMTMNMATTAIACASIDDDPVTFPLTELQLDAIIQRLDFDGFTAVNEALASMRTDPDREKESAKN
jgi:hypothetical protein